MKHREEFFITPEGLSIYYQYWQPQDAPRAVILLLHGAGEHSSRYARLAEFFSAHGYVIAALDHPGHGKSAGSYGFINRFEDYLDTFAVFHQQVSTDFFGLPQILLGHSMGGLIGANYLLQHQQEFVGCVLSGPAIKIETAPSLLQMLLIRFLSAVLPKTGTLQLDASGVSRDPVEVERYRNDPLVHHGKISARMVAQMFKWMDHLQANAGKMSLPMLLLHGGEDPMVTPEGSRFLHKHISSTDKTLKIYPGLYHEIFNEAERESIFISVLDWCNLRIG